MKYSNTSAATAACILMFLINGNASAQSASLIRVTDTFNWAVPSPDPTGVVYVPGASALLITDSEVEETALFSGSNLFQTELDGSVVNLFSTLDFTPEPTGITINPNNNHLFISMDDSPRRIFEIDPGPDGIYRNTDDTITSFSTTGFNCFDAEGVAYNSVNGVLHIACGVANNIYTVDPGPNQLFDGVAPAGDDTVSSFDTSGLGLIDPEGIVHDGASDTLYVIGKPKSQLLHVTTDGQFIRTITLDSTLLYKPAGLALGPSSLNNGAESLYLVDRGVDNDSNPDENDGRLFEFALPSQSSNEAPVIQISAPTGGENYQNGDPISFVAMATDQEDGDLSSAVTWHSDIDGTFGSGAALTTSGLSIGLHTITASCADSSLAQAFQVIQIRVLPAGSNIIEARIDRSSDDAEQRGLNGNTWIDGNDLELVFDNPVTQIVGLRFNALSIPAGAFIEEASIQFQADEIQSSPVLMQIRAQSSDNAEPIRGRKNNLTDRSTTAAASIWQPDDWQVIGEAGLHQKTSDLSALVQEVVNRPGWSNGNSMAFLITGSSTTYRTAVSFDGDPAAAPLLQVRYSLIPQNPVLAIASPLDGTLSDDESPVNLTATVSDPQEGDLSTQVSWSSNLDGSLATGNSTVLLTPGLHTITATVSDADGNNVSDSVTVQIDRALAPGTFIIESRIESSSDDAEQRGVNGNTWISGNDLELVFDNPVAQMVGLRFNALSIPAGAFIEEASIQFQADESQSSPVLMQIRAQSSDNAEPIRGRKNNLTDRSTTAAASIWQPDDWLVVGEAATRQKTADLSALVQEVVNRPGWSNGNSMAFLITGSSTTYRTAVSFDGDPAAAPLLQVRYSLIPQNPVLAIASPLDGTLSDDESPVNLTATVSDPQEGDLSTQVSWSSNLDGSLATGNSTVLLTPGLHTITATVSDADGNNVSDSVTVQIDRALAPGTFIIETRIESSSDDAEQRGLGGNTWIDGNDLELVDDAALAQIVGLRFTDLAIPIGANVEEAFIQFQADETQSSPVLLEIRAQSSDDAEKIRARKNNLTNRSTTTAFRTWEPADWQVIGESGVNQKTTDLSTLVQEVIDRPGWSSGNSMAFLITGSSTMRRTAESFDGEPSAAPLLHIRYSTPQSAAMMAKTAASVNSLAAESSENPVANSVDLTAQITDELTPEAPTLTVTSLLAGSLFDNVEMQANAGDSPDVTTLSLRITLERDDASEHNGLMELDSSVLELVVDDSQHHQVGLRFNDVQIPRDAGILSAFIQFQAAGTSEELAFITLTVQDSDNPEVFENSDYNISQRPRSAAGVTWLAPAWSAQSLAGPDQKTPDLSHLIQNIVTREGWAAGNSIALFLEGDGERLAEAIEGNSEAAPELIVAFTTQNAAPSVDSGTDQYLFLSDSAILNGTVFDDSLPGEPRVLDLLWSVSKGPGPVVFSDPTNLATHATFKSEGTYQLRLTASDGQLTAFDEVTIDIISTDH